MYGRAVLLLMVSLELVLPGAIAKGQVVISQLFGAGGNMGAAYHNDFVELFNAGVNTADLAGWSIQYSNATTNTWSKTSLTGTIPPGGYFLIQEAPGNPVP